MDSTALSSSCMLVGSAGCVGDASDMAQARGKKCGNMATLVSGGLTQQTRSLDLDNQLHFDKYKIGFKHVCTKYG